MSLRDHVQADGEHRAILLVGEGPAFCAGFDLDRCRDAGQGEEAMRSLLSGLSAVVWAMRRQTRPVVLAAHGAAIAAVVRCSAAPMWLSPIARQSSGTR